MKKSMNKISTLVASTAMILAVSPASVQAKTVKAPSIPKKIVVWADPSVKEIDVGSGNQLIKNASKSITIKGKNSSNDHGVLDIPTTNKNIAVRYTKAFKYNYFYLVNAETFNGNVKNLIGQSGTAKFDIVQNNKTYHMSTKFIIKRNPGRFQYIKLNGKNILKKFKENKDLDFIYSAKLANKKVTVSYKANYPNLNPHLTLERNVKSWALKKNKPFLVKKGDYITISVTPPTWDNEAAYAIIVK